MSAEYQMEIDQGAAYELLLTIVNPTGTPFDLTGHVFSGQIRKYAGAPDIEASFTFATTANPGEILVRMAAADSSAIVLPVNKNVKRVPVDMAYDIESVFSGTRTRWIEGVVKINPEVTL